jgi:hypothetical protein
MVFPVTFLAAMVCFALVRNFWAGLALGIVVSVASLRLIFFLLGFTSLNAIYEAWPPSALPNSAAEYALALVFAATFRTIIRRIWRQHQKTAIGREHDH